MIFKDKIRLTGICLVVASTIIFLLTSMLMMIERKDMIEQMDSTPYVLWLFLLNHIIFGIYFVTVAMYKLIYKQLKQEYVILLCILSLIGMCTLHRLFLLPEYQSIAWFWVYIATISLSVVFFFFHRHIPLLFRWSLCFILGSVFLLYVCLVLFACLLIFLFLVFEPDLQW
jgi:hypothetical protein